MAKKNLDDLVRAIRSCRVSEEFTQGVLFLLGGTLMRTGPGVSQADVVRSLQWVVAHDINEVADDILGRMYDGKIQRVVEELLYKLNLEIPTRDIRVGEVSLRLLTPADHGLLASPDLADLEMSAVSTLYFSATELIGSVLAESDYSDEEAYLAGICLFSMWAQTDNGATSSIISDLAQLAPPILKFFLSVPRSGGTNLSAWLPVQFALWGFVNGVEDDFIQIMWPCQSWLLFKDQKPILGVEDLSDDGFFLHCYGISKNFAAANAEKIQLISELDVGPNDVPLFTGLGDERAAIYEVMKSVWGYSVDDPRLTYIEKLQVKACLVFLIFCSICRSGREGVEFLKQVTSEPENKSLTLEPCPPVNSLDDFAYVAQEKIRSYQKFSLCTAFEVGSEQEFRFFASHKPTDPPAMRSLLVDIIVATKTSQIFVMYLANVAQHFDEDLGQFQSILFRVDAKGSAPYWFCRMPIAPDGWKIEPFTSMTEEDPQGILFLSDLVQEFHERSPAEISSARTRLEAWLPEEPWSWQKFDL